MKVSVVVTVLNESGSIVALLNSLYKQTVLPNEVIVVDGGSSDDTVCKIKQFSSKHKVLAIHLIEEKGNISHGRNVGVEIAKNKVIAMIDAGCAAKNTWLEKISRSFNEKQNIIVAGFYEMKAKSAWQKAVTPFLGVTSKNFNDKTYLPSARSIAFSKSVWAKVHGFNETLLSAGEDTLFSYEASKQGISIVRAKDAMVIWEVPKTLYTAAKKFYFYAKGDAQTKIWWHPAKKFSTHNIKILSIYVRYLFFLLFLASGGFIYVYFMYLLWSMWKHRRDVDKRLALLLVPVVQIVSDICVMAGFASGYI